MRRCGNCERWAGSALTLIAERKPCGYPLPAFMATFFTQAMNMLATDGQGCAVHRFEGEEG